MAAPAGAATICPPSISRPGPKPSIVDAIGNTPLVELPRLSPPGSRLYAKLEGANPSGSVKDRPARFMLEAAETAGRLARGSHLLEATSGNTGIALAMLARVKGYRITVVVPENVTSERVQLLRLYGAEVVFSPAEGGANEAISVARRLATTGEYVMLDQYTNAANPRAHYETTACEILRDLPGLTAFVAGLGTGGTLMGVARRLAEEDPSIDVVGVEPLLGDLVQGLRNMGEGFVPPIFDPDRLDAKYLVDSQEAARMSRLLLHEEGIFAGPSSGAVLLGAIRYAERHRGAEVVVLLADGGWKYMSAGVYDTAVAGEQLESVSLW